MKQFIPSFLYLSVFSCFALSGCKNTGSPRIEFEKPFEEIAQTAGENKRFLGIVLSNPDCPPCKILLDFLYGEAGKTIGDKAIFNIVDVSLPQNKWYEQLIASKTIPTTLLFSPYGNLEAIIQGTSKAETDCITEFFNGRADCSLYRYSGHFSPYTKNEEVINAFDLLLKAKVKLDKQEDTSAELKESLKTLYYPYGIELQIRNERNKGNEEEAVYWAKQMLKFQDRMYAVLYPDLYMAARYVINPQFNPEDMPALEIKKDTIDLGECKVNEAIDFKIPLKNAGKETLLVHDVTVSCSCLKLRSKNSAAIEAGGEDYLDLTFTANAPGNIEREVMLTSNGMESFKTIKILAYAKQ